MSLICELYVNSIINGAGEVVITRIKGTTVADSKNIYKYELYDSGNNEVIRKGVVTHVYGDGAMKLLYLVMKDAFEEVCESYSVGVRSDVR